MTLDNLMRGSCELELSKYICDTIELFQFATHDRIVGI